MTEPTDDPNDARLADRLRRAARPESDAPTLSPTLVTGASARRAPRLIDHGRVTRAAGVSITAVAAVAVGSLVIANPFAARAPLFTAADGLGAASSESAAMSSDARMGVWVNYEYLAGGQLSTSGGRGNVYQLERAGEPRDVLQDVAALFGLPGEPGESDYFDPAYPTYVIGSEDGTSPSISVTWAGTGSWWYNDPTAYPASVCERVPYEVETDAGVVEEFIDECIVPEVAAADSLAPSEDEARTIAADLFAASGLDVVADDIRVTVDPWQTAAMANLVVDGVTTALDYGVGWTTTGEIAWAYGHSIEVVERGRYDTVSAASAVERLDDWRWFGAAGPDFQGGMNVLAAESGLARDTAVGLSDPDAPVSSTAEPGAEPGVVPDPAEPTDPGSSGEPGGTTDPGAPTEEPGVESLPEPMPEPETVTVTVETAETTLLLMWDSQGNAWLVPGFAMQHPDGYWNSVVSLIEGVIELPGPVLVDDGVIEPMPAIED